MRRALAVFLAAVLFLDIICLGVIFFTRDTSSNRKKADDGIFERAVIMAAGNNMISDKIIEQAAAGNAPGNYNFDPVYENIADELSRADAAVITQESVISPEHPVSGPYPLYNSPAKIADELKKLGFNIINIATNHALDYGEQGLLNTIDCLKNTERLGVIGAVADKEYASAPIIRNIKGIKVAFIAFTDPIPQKSLPEDSPAYLCVSSDESLIYDAVASAKRQADFVVVCAHWGKEYGADVTPEQRAMAKKLGEWGADVVIGTNPHELQEMEYIDNTDGSRTLVAYSLGNFVSTQTNGELLLGGLLSFELVRNTETGAVTLENPKMKGVVTHYGIDASNTRLYMLSDYTSELANVHAVDRSRTPDFSLRYLKKLMSERISSEFAE